MKTKIKSCLAVVLTGLAALLCSVSYGQSANAVIRKYMGELPKAEVKPIKQKYRMTAVYINRDLYGNFTGKTKVTGDYTSGLENGNVRWNNVYISTSDKFDEPFPEGKKQEYIEDMTYIPSSKMIEKESFKNFPSTIESVFVKNLVWDMFTIETYAWDFTDSLQLNKKYIINGNSEKFDMADIGTYAHNNIILCWAGISQIDNELCAVIEYSTTDNLLRLDMNQIKSKGTEQYWGTTWISLETKQIEYAEMYSGTIQEIQVKGMDNKFITKTIRELELKKIQ